MNSRTVTNQEDAAAATQPERPHHSEKIKSQVLAKIGRPPRFDRVEVCRHHNRKYRVGYWQQSILNKNIAVSPNSRIGLSYYLTVSDTGEIIDSAPPMTKVFFDP
jgi:hypothetical protein